MIIINFLEKIAHENNIAAMRCGHAPNMTIVIAAQAEQT